MHPIFSLAKRKLDDAKREFEFVRRIEMGVVPKILTMNDLNAAAAASALRATAIEGVYTGAEGVLKEILSAVGEDVTTKSDSWHARLLAQAAEANPDTTRGAILSQSVYEDLDKLRAFRHIKRSVYRHHLQARGVEENLARLQDVFPKFVDEVERFITEYGFTDDDNNT
jgi:hypothetical protein